MSAPRKAAKKPSAEASRKTVAEMKGRMTQADIARREGVSRQQVSKRLKAYGVEADADGLYDIETYRGLALRADSSKSLEDAKRDDIIAATRLKELKIAEAEGHLISRDLAIDLLSSLAQAYISSIENVLETKDDREAAKAQLRADYAGILKRLPRLLARLDAAHPIEGPAQG